MGKQLDARTEWEVDAARRREVIAADFAARRTLRPETREAEMAHDEASSGWLSSVRAAFSASAPKVDDVPCDHSGAMTPVKPGA